jgi:hypothetical protein
VKSPPLWPEINDIVKEGINRLNAQTRTEYEMKAIRLKLTLAIIEDILKCSSKF